MRGTIHYCLEEAVIEKYGQKKWEQCLTTMGLPADHSFVSQIRDDIDEALTMKFIANIPSVLECDLQEIFDVFGDYWSVIYAPKMYGMFYIGVKTTKEMVLKLSNIHVIVAKVKENATPPFFEYKTVAENIVEVTYVSKRGLFDLYISLVRGLDKYFKNETLIEKLTDNSARMTFSHV